MTIKTLPLLLALFVAATPAPTSGGSDAGPLPLRDLDGGIIKPEADFELPGDEPKAAPEPKGLLERRQKLTEVLFDMRRDLRKIAAPDGGEVDVKVLWSTHSTKTYDAAMVVFTTPTRGETGLIFVFTSGSGWDVFPGEFQ